MQFLCFFCDYDLNIFGLSMSQYGGNLSILAPLGRTRH